MKRGLSYRDLFLEHMKEKRRRSLVYIYVLGLTVNPAFLILDYYVVTDHYLRLFLVRFFVFLCCAALLVIYKKIPRLMWMIDAFGSVPIVCLSIHIAVIIYYTGGSVSPYEHGLILMALVSGLYV